MTAQTMRFIYFEEDFFTTSEKAIHTILTVLSSLTLTLSEK